MSPQFDRATRRGIPARATITSNHHDQTTTTLVAATAVVAAITAGGWIGFRWLGQLVRCALTPVGNAWQDGYEVGHDRGYRDCQEHYNPTVVKLHSNRQASGS